MRKSRFTEEQIIAILKENDASVIRRHLDNVLNYLAYLSVARWGRDCVRSAIKRAFAH